MKDVVPKSNACVRVESALSNRLQSRLFKLLKKVIPVLKNKRQWKRPRVVPSIL